MMMLFIGSIVQNPGNHRHTGTKKFPRRLRSQAGHVPAFGPLLRPQVHAQLHSRQWWRLL
jgi:ribosomal protein L25 (general stress protein Ctc)